MTFSREASFTPCLFLAFPPSLAPLASQSLSKQESNLPHWLGPDPRLPQLRATFTNKRLETALKTAANRLQDQEAELATLRSLVLSQGISKPQTPGLVTYSARQPRQSTSGAQPLSLDLAKGAGQMGLPRASATDHGMDGMGVSSRPARYSRADEIMDASFVQQLQQKLKTPKELSKEILTQLGLRGAGRNGVQPGGRVGEESKSADRIQQSQAGALSQVTFLLDGSVCTSWEQEKGTLGLS